MSNILLHCEASVACSALHDDVRFDLVYLDPPFGTGQVMKTRDGRDAYDDRIDPEALGAMISRVVGRVRMRMNDRAFLFVHLDYRFVHEAKVTIDKVFGRDKFQGEIIWAKGNGARGKGIPCSHDTILIWSKSKDCVWSSEHPSMREPYTETSIDINFKQVDENGRRYRDRTVNGKTYRYYADEGKRMGSVWTDCSSMTANSPFSAESIGYPTQKPEKLLERIIRGGSKEGDVVADLMCGSGTTLAVAHKLGRRFVGSDKGAVAVETTRNRLDSIGATYDLIHHQ